MVNVSFVDSALQGQSKGSQISTVASWLHVGLLESHTLTWYFEPKMNDNVTMTFCVHTIDEVIRRNHFLVQLKRNPNSEKLKNDLLRHEGALELCLGSEFDGPLCPAKQVLQEIGK